MLAADALAWAALLNIREHKLWTKPESPKDESQPERLRSGEFVLASIYLNELGDHQQTVWTAELASQILRAVLDQLLLEQL
jgi:hypothetical protein